MRKARTVEVKNVKISDGFWDKYRKLVREEILDYQWDALNDRVEGAAKSHCIENFRIAAGEKEGEFYGAVFQDSDAAKWLEAVAYSLAEHPDKELEKRADDLIDLIGRAQQPDGYFNTYFILKEPQKRFANLREGHELYTLGHMIEAAVAYYQATGKRRFLEIVRRMADLVDETFGPQEGKRKGMPGHQEIELALVKLYDVTGEKRYLELAKYFIDVRGAGEENYFLEEMKRPGQTCIFPELSDYRPEYSQFHLPVREQKTAEGHAVRAVYMYCAMADLAEKYEDEELLKACETLMKNIVTKRMYVTGGIGSSGILERFTTDYDLPNGFNYSESCASIGLALFARRMLLITKDGKYGDIMERALYNTVLAGISQDGKRFFYVNPLEVWPPACMERTSREHVKSSRQKWFGVACCPANIARTLASLGEYVYSYEEDTVYVNLFVSGTALIPLKSGQAEICVRTDFPWSRQVEIEVKREDVPGADMMLAVRVPEYVQGISVHCPGEEQSGPESGRETGSESGRETSRSRGSEMVRQEKGYVYIPCRGEGTYMVRFEERTGEAGGKSLSYGEADGDSLCFTPRFVRANPQVREDAGKVCVVCGPLVYAAEEIDNGANLAALYVDTSKPVRSRWEENLAGGTMVLEAAGKRISQDGWDGDMLYGEAEMKLEDTTIRLVPYAYWNNRGEGEMTVWMKEMTGREERELI